MVDKVTKSSGRKTKQVIVRKGIIKSNTKCQPKSKYSNKNIRKTARLPNKIKNAIPALKKTQSTTKKRSTTTQSRKSVSKLNLLSSIKFNNYRNSKSRNKFKSGSKYLNRPYRSSHFKTTLTTTSMNSPRLGSKLSLSDNRKQVPSLVHYSRKYCRHNSNRSLTSQSSNTVLRNINSTTGFPLYGLTMDPKHMKKNPMLSNLKVPDEPKSKYDVFVSDLHCSLKAKLRGRQIQDTYFEHIMFEVWRSLNQAQLEDFEYMASLDKIRHSKEQEQFYEKLENKFRKRNNFIKKKEEHDKILKRLVKGKLRKMRQAKSNIVKRK